MKTMALPPGMTFLVDWLKADYSDLLADLSPKDVNVITQQMRWDYFQLRWRCPRKVNGINIYHKVEDKPLLERVLLPYKQ